MSQGTHAQLRNLAQKRAQLKNYNVAQQKLKVNDRNQALAVLNAQFSQNQQSAGVAQRQLYLQEQQNLQKRNQAVNMLNQQTIQNQQMNTNYTQQPGFNPMMQQQSGFNPMMQQQSGFNPMMQQQPGFNPMMQQQSGFNPMMQQQPGFNPMMQQPGFNPMQQQQMYNTAIPQNTTTTPANVNTNSIYNAPPWSSKPIYKYQLRLIENGTVSYVDLTGKPYILIGRQDTCDVQLETPSVSRNHAVIQHRGGGSQQGSDEIFIYDLSSTSGSFLNSQQLNPKSYYALQPGDIINFATSPDFVLCGGPNNYQPPLPVIQEQLPSNTNQVDTKQAKLDDEIDAIIHARCSDHLVSSLAQLESLFEKGIILDEEYYKKKALIQDQMQKQQEEMRAKIRQKKSEARAKQDLENLASEQKLKQEQIHQKAMNSKLTKTVDTSSIKPKKEPEITQTITSESNTKQSNDLDKIFSSTISNKNSNIGSFSTIKMDPRSKDFDAVAYKQMMVEQYEQQKRDNEIKLRLRKLGDPTSSEFNPGEYKRLMIEKYEHERQMEETKRLIKQEKDKQ